MPESQDEKKRNLVEQSCTEFEQDIRLLLLGILRDKHTVDDVFQKTVMKALAAAESIQTNQRKTVRSWLLKIAINEARQLKRSGLRDQKAKRAVWDSLVNREEFAQSAEAEFLNDLVSAERREIVQKALARLPDNYRDIVDRRIRREQSFATIAQEMNRPLGTVLTWMRRALHQLKEMNDIRQLEDL